MIPHLVALVNLYDEGVSNCIGLADELARLGVDHVIIVEGPYALFPDKERTYDRAAEQFALHGRLADHGILADEESRTEWPGNEVEKRQRALELGIATGTRWLLIWDADFVAEDPTNLRPMLDHMTSPYGDFVIHEDEHESRWRNRPLLEVQPGMHYEGNHHTIVFSNGAKISTGYIQDWEKHRGHLIPITIRHARKQRADERKNRQQAYYEERDRLGIEEGVAPT